MTSLRWPLIVSASVGLVALIGCYEPHILGALEPDASCEYSTKNVLRGAGLLDIGPTEAMANAYEAAVLVDGRPGAEISSMSVAFEADGEPLPDVTYEGRAVVFPSVEGERYTDQAVTLDEDGRGVARLDLVTEAEAAALQTFTSVGEDLQLRVELRAFVDGWNTLPFFVPLTVCEQCLVGVGAEVQGGELVCPDGSAPSVVDNEPCSVGRDYVYSTCGPS
jgi:hypothetical protein